jgi:hypothetical protein
MSNADIEVTIVYNDEDVDATVDYTVTYWGAPEQGPTYSCGGQPAEGPEFEINSITVGEEEVKWDDLSKDNQEQIEEAIYEQIKDGPTEY